MRGISAARRRSLRGRSRGDALRQAYCDLGLGVEPFATLPWIFMTLLRQAGWPVCAYSHTTDPHSWCFKINKISVITLDEAGGAVWKAVSRGEQERLEAVHAEIDATRAALAAALAGRPGSVGFGTHPAGRAAHQR